MISQIVFLAVLLVTLGVFGYTTRKYIAYFKITKGKFPVRADWPAFRGDDGSGHRADQDLQKACSGPAPCPCVLGIPV